MGWENCHAQTWRVCILQHKKSNALLAFIMIPTSRTYFINHLFLDRKRYALLCGEQHRLGGVRELSTSTEDALRVSTRWATLASKGNWCALCGIYGTMSNGFSFFHELVHHYVAWVIVSMTLVFVLEKGGFYPRKNPLLTLYKQILESPWIILLSASIRATSCSLSPRHYTSQNSVKLLSLLLNIFGTFGVN
jgi:hypothetical protein